MLSGVYFDQKAGSVQPTFINRYVLTDVFLASNALGVKTPILPSIATLLGGLTSLHLVLFAILRAVFLAFCSFFTASPMRHLSVANTSLLWHDGRALATCESGPMTWVTLPELDTVGNWSLEGDEGEKGLREGMLGWMKEWTTAHVSLSGPMRNLHSSLTASFAQPKFDPHTGELMLFHMTFLPPYLSYSVVPSTYAPIPTEKKPVATPRILAAPVPIAAPRMMHDMAASRTHSILLDSPLSLDPRNLAVGKPVIGYEPESPTRFGVFPRHAPNLVRWYHAPACIIFHTAFAYDEYEPSSPADLAAVNLVCCRMNSPRLVYAAGNLVLPESQSLPAGAKEECELYYYRFPTTRSASQTLEPSHQFPLAAIPFEFPTVPQERVVGPAKYVYGCSVKHGNFDAALGGAAKIDCLVKVNTAALIRKGIKRAEAGAADSELPVDPRGIAEVLAEQTGRSGERRASGSTEVADCDDVPIRIFELPPAVYAQESSFVSRKNPRSEDDGFLLTYVFDERQIDPVSGKPFKDARSELWIIDAWDMSTVVAKVKLPQRGKLAFLASFASVELTLRGPLSAVPYGLHGHWFASEDLAHQRPPPSIRSRPTSIP